MSGLLKVDARSTPSISFKQDMKGIAIGPLLVDAINNDMLSGKGTLNLDITTSGNTVSALKKALAGKAAINLADGAVKGVDIAGTLRDVKSKVNIFKDKSSLGADQSKKTDFSELTASFDIKNLHESRCRLNQSAAPSPSANRLAAIRAVISGRRK